MDTSNTVRENWLSKAKGNCCGNIGNPKSPNGFDILGYLREDGDAEETVCLSNHTKDDIVAEREEEEVEESDVEIEVDTSESGSLVKEADEDIGSRTDPTEMPIVPEGPMTRSKAKQLRRRFGTAIQAFVNSPGPGDPFGIAAERRNHRQNDRPNDLISTEGCKFPHPSDYDKTNRSSGFSHTGPEPILAEGPYPETVLAETKEASSYDGPNDPISTEGGKFSRPIGYSKANGTGSFLLKDAEQPAASIPSHLAGKNLQKAKEGVEAKELQELEDDGFSVPEDLLEDFTKLLRAQDAPKSESPSKAPHAPPWAASHQCKLFTLYTVLAGVPSTNND